jgi:hypothetical protein
MHKIEKINTKILTSLINELSQYKRDFPTLPFEFDADKLKLINTSDRDTLKSAFEIINSSIVLSKITFSDLGINLNTFLQSSMLWTYPQLRIDCDANKAFSAPFHKDGFILGDKLKGIVIWIPISSEGGSLQIVTREGETLIERNKIWGLECKCENHQTENIKISYGEALIFDESLIHKSQPLNTGQVTLQLRYFEPSLDFFYRPVVQKSSDEIIKFQNQFK